MLYYQKNHNPQLPNFSPLKLEAWMANNIYQNLMNVHSADDITICRAASQPKNIKLGNNVLSAVFDVSKSLSLILTNI